MVLLKLQLKRVFIANFHFPEATVSFIVALNSSNSQKLAVLAFTFIVNTFLSLTENGGNLTNSDVFVMLNVGGLQNPESKVRVKFPQNMI